MINNINYRLVIINFLTNWLIFLNVNIWVNDVPSFGESPSYSTIYIVPMMSQQQCDFTTIRCHDITNTIPYIHPKWNENGFCYWTESCRGIKKCIYALHVAQFKENPLFLICNIYNLASLIMDCWYWHAVIISCTLTAKYVTFFTIFSVV